MRIAILLVTITLFTLSGTASAQPGIEWERTFEHPDGWKLTHLGSTETDDGGVIIVGYAFPDEAVWEDIDMFALKLNRDLEVEWYGQYGDYVEEADEAIFIHELCYDAIQTSDGGYLLAGDLNVYVSEEYLYVVPYLIKIDSHGELEWHRHYLKDVDYEHHIASRFVLIRELENGDFFALTGRKYIFRISSEGDSLTTISLDDDEFEYLGIRDITYLNEERFILTGAVGVESHAEFYFTEIDNEGRQIWSNNFGIRGWDTEAFFIYPLEDEGYIVYGNKDNNMEMDVVLFKIGDRGEEVWRRDIGLHGVNYPYDLQPTMGNGIIFSTSSSSAGRNYFYVIRTDSEGRELWRLVADRGVRGGHASARLFTFTDGSYLIVIKDDGILHLIKTESDPVYVDEQVNDFKPNEFTLFPAYPNPFNSTTTIRYNLPMPTHVSLQIYNLSGQRMTTLFEGYRQPGIHSTILNANDLPTGLYFVQLGTSREMKVRKIICIK